MVGLGASAGGLAALEAFFDSMTGHSGMAFVVITHQAPEHVSQLPALLGRRTSMPVTLMKDGAHLEADHVYVARPGTKLALTGGVLRTVRATGSGPVRFPIDHFFEQLARDRRELAVGVVLSGTGTDGTAGVSAISAHGGLTLVQDESSAGYSGMPLSAGRYADHVLAPADMAERLMRHARAVPAEGPDVSAGRDELSPLFRLLRSRTGQDFRGYKPNPLLRRIERHMLRSKTSTTPEYLDFLRANPGEIDALFHALLIGVTSFFRDEKSFTALESSMRRLLVSKTTDSPVRIWVPGCSTGEEAYSIAILVTELIDRLDKHFAVQIFATDLDPSSIQRARAATYSGAGVRGAGSSRVARFFTRSGNRYQVRPEIRSMVVFAVHDVGKDPPFTRLDLLSCRNLLIYLDSSLQAVVLPLFHYALDPLGLLFLGSAETTGPFDHLFSPIDRSARLYARSRSAPAPALPAVLPASHLRRAQRSGVSRREYESTNAELQSTHEQLETSTEELQSTNEELQTVNTELLSKMDQLTRAHDDLQNLLDSTDIATLFLDRDLRIQRYTARASEVMTLIPGDVGRKVDDLVPRLRYDALAADSQKVLDSGKPYEREVQTSAGAWRLLRIFPYRTSKDLVDGVVVTFLDVDRLKHAEALATSRAFAESIVQTVREPLVVLDTRLCIVSANRAFRWTFSLIEGQASGLSLFDVEEGFFPAPRLRPLLHGVLTRGEVLEDLELRRPQLDQRRYLMNARRLENDTTLDAHLLLVLSEAGLHLT